MTPSYCNTLEDTASKQCITPIFTQAAQPAPKSGPDFIDRLNNKLNQDGLVTNKTDKAVQCIVQNEDHSFSIEQLDKGETKGVEAFCSIPMAMANQTLPRAYLTEQF